MNQVLGLVAIAAFFSALYRAYMVLCRLPERAYDSPVLCLELVRHPIALAVVLAPATPLLANWKTLRWSAIDAGLAIRPFVSVLCLLFGLSLAVWPRNKYWGRSYPIDRALVLASAVLAFWHPGFAALTAGTGTLLLSQIGLPLTPNSSPLELVRDRMPWPYFILLFVAWTYGVLLFHATAADLTIVLLAGFGSTYVWSAVSKLELAWVHHGELAAAVNTAVAHGKISPNSPWFHRVVSVLMRFNKALMIAVVFVELAPTLLCVRLELTLALLTGLSVFQLVVSRLSGIDFRSWALVGGLLAFLVLRLSAFHIFEPEAFLGSCVLLLFATILLSPWRLAWLDARLSNVFRFYLVAEDGTAEPLDCTEFGPYGNVFFRGRFQYTADVNLAVDTWGETTDIALVHALRHCKSDEEVRVVESKFGRVYKNKALTDVLDKFLRKYLSERSAPNVSIRLARVFFDGDISRLLDEKEVHRTSLRDRPNPESDRTETHR